MFTENFVYNLTLKSHLSSSLSKLYSNNYFNLIELEILKKNSMLVKVFKANKGQDLEDHTTTNLKILIPQSSCESYINKEQLKEIGDVLEVLGQSNDLDIIPPKHLITKLRTKKSRRKKKTDIEPTGETHYPLNNYGLDIQEVFFEVGDKLISNFISRLSKLITISIIFTVNGLSSNNFCIEERAGQFELAVIQVKRCICDFSDILSIILSPDFNELINLLQFTKEEAIYIFYFLLDYFLTDEASLTQMSN